MTADHPEKICDQISDGILEAIGVAESGGIHLETFGTNTIEEDKILEAVKASFDFRPPAIINQLELKRPVFKQTAAYGHFGSRNLFRRRLIKRNF